MEIHQWEILAKYFKEETQKSKMAMRKRTSLLPSALNRHGQLKRK